MIWPFKNAYLTISLCTLSAINATVGQAAENLWLDVARASITTHEIHEHVSVLADDTFEGREAGSRGGRAAAQYIIERLKQASLQPAGNNDQFKQTFMHNQQNLLAVLPGSDPELSQEFIVVGAHYDHVGYGSRRNSFGPWGYIHNGADDNASGVAAQLEVIDSLARSEHRPRRSLLFAFWDGEEKGLLGSKHWVANPTVPLEAVKLAINIDMVGRMTKGRIEVGGTRSAVGLRRLFSSSRLGAGQWLDFNWEFKNNSDHWTFFKARIPSLYVHTGLHDDYHRPSDDVEKLNVDGIRQVSAYVLEQLCELADADQLPKFRHDAQFDNPVLQKHYEKPLAPLASRLDFAWEFIPSEPPAIAVQSISRNSFAWQAGLRTGDRIVNVAGQCIASATHLSAVALQQKSNLPIQVKRHNSDDSLSINLPLVGSPTRLGLSWRTDPAEPQAVYITRVVPYSPAARAGIKLYDRLYQFNGQPITGADPLLAEIRGQLDSDATQLQFQVESRGRIQEVNVLLDLLPPPVRDATL